MRTALILLSSVTALLLTERAEACGCFVPPNPATPIVQAGERILFARENGQVVAHIQIRYAGSAADFGWLLPLPALPELELGTDELFTELDVTTAPRYSLVPEYVDCSSGSAGSSGFGCGGSADSSAGNGGLPRPGADASAGAVVAQASIGPYDYAVLRADDKVEMLDWLADNRYFVPAGTDDVVNPYIRPGAFFLALKLRAGESTGALQPVVVRYDSDLPMIPIVLTSVAAQPDMGIQVFMLGNGRAIPRNYSHTVLNDAQLDWVNGGANYGAAVSAATREAQGRHTFITEYAGPSVVMKDRLAAPGRFGTRAELAAQLTIDALIETLNREGYRTPRTVGYSSALLAILQHYAPMPAGLGPSPAIFYPNLAQYRTIYATQLAGWPEAYDRAALAGEIWERIAAPTIATSKLFDDHPMLTRLYGVLSPAEMTKDPVFSENKGLSQVSNVHQGRAVYHCRGDSLSALTPVTVITEQGHHIRYPTGLFQARTSPATAGSLRIETLAEEGAPQVVTDNAAAIAAALPAMEMDEGDGGCRLARGGSFSAVLLLLFGYMRLRRRRSR